MKRYLEKVHNITLQKVCEDEPLNKKLCIQSNLGSMIKKISLDERLTCFEAVDVFSIRRTMKSAQTYEFLREKVNLWLNHQKSL